MSKIYLQPIPSPEPSKLAEELKSKFFSTGRKYEKKFIYSREAKPPSWEDLQKTKLFNRPDYEKQYQWNL